MTNYDPLVEAFQICHPEPHVVTLSAEGLTMANYDPVEAFRICHPEPVEGRLSLSIAMTEGRRFCR